MRYWTIDVRKDDRTGTVDVGAEAVGNAIALAKKACPGWTVERIVEVDAVQGRPINP